MKKHIILGILALMLLTQVFGLQVGMDPSGVELGEVQPGESESFSIGISESEPGVELNFVHREPTDSNFESHYGGLEEVSKQDTENWVHVIGGTQTLEEPFETTINDRDVEANKVVEGILNVPENAEPGKYLVYLRPEASTDSDDQLSIQAVSTFKIAFEVPGEVVRDGRLIGTSTEAVSNSTVRSKTYFENTGTVTKDIDIEHFNEDANESRVVSERVSPGTIEEFRVNWPASEIESEGNLSVEADWNTGSQALVSQFSRSSSGEIFSEQNDNYSFLTILSMLLVVTAIADYGRRKIEFPDF